jgi:serine protease
VAAAGNSGSNNDTTPFYPGSYTQDNVVSVAAVDSNNQLASFSNFGATSVDIAAPGVSIVSTLPGGSYGSLSGTSMATPHVTGVIALVRDQHPDWTYQKVISRVLSTAAPMPGLTGKTVTGGVVDAAAATLGMASGGSASFVGADSATQGSWQGVYGADGYNVIGASTAYPAYATVAASGQSSFTWAPSTTDPRALQQPGSASRIAACWYASGSFTVDLNLTDGQQHRVALYLLDWDSQGRSERIDILDAASGAILDSRSAAGFAAGD